MLDGIRKYINKLGLKISALAGREYVGMSVKEWFNLGDYGYMTDSGMYVDSETSRRAGVIFACIRILGGCISTSPAQVFKRTADGGRELATNHPQYWKLHAEPSPMMSAAVLFETFVSHIYLHGNGLILLDRNYGGEVENYYLLDPRQVKIEQAERRLRYYVPLESGGYRVYDQDDMIHVPNVFVDVKNGKGMAPIDAGAQAIGLLLSADRRSAAYLKNSPASDIALQYPKQMTENLKEEARKYVREHNAGINSGSPLILSEGGTAQTLTIDAAKMQLLQAREYQVIEIGSRYFGLPPWLLGAVEKQTSWGTGIEQMNIGMVAYTINPLTVRIEQEWNRKVFRRSGYFMEHNLSGLLRGDEKTTVESFKAAIGGNQLPGWMTVNEVRKIRNLPPDTDPESSKLYRPPVNNGSKDNGQAVDATQE
jgi:HK97 family phage portal protein